MSAQQEAIALWRYLESRGLKPSVRTIAGVLRGQHLRFRDEDLCAWLQPCRAVSRKHLGNEKHAQGKQSGNDRETASREKEVSLSRNSSTPLLRNSVDAPGLFATDPTATKERRRPPKRPPDTAWVEMLRETVRPWLEREVRSLTADERFELARLHCVKFANCCRDAARNRQRALKVAAGIANLSLHRVYGLWTVSEYLGEMGLAWERGGRVPLYSAWFATMGVQSATG